MFALLAVGLTLNYKTSGVFNLAFAAQAYASAAVFYVLRRDHDWPLLPAAFVAIFVLGVAMAWVLDRFLYRHQRTALAAGQAGHLARPARGHPRRSSSCFIGSARPRGPAAAGPGQATASTSCGTSRARCVLDANQIATIVCTVVVVVGLVVLFRRGALGLRMRAVVESPRLLQLQGVDAERVALSSWVLSSLLASLAGVLIAPLFAQLDSTDFFTLLVAALAACVIGNLTSIPGALLGGLGLGVAPGRAGRLPADRQRARPAACGRRCRSWCCSCCCSSGRSLRKRRADHRPAGRRRSATGAAGGAACGRDWMTVATRIFGVVAVAVGLFLVPLRARRFWDLLVIVRASAWR